jgi:hypothetical protein
MYYETENYEIINVKIAMQSISKEVGPGFKQKSKQRK